VRKFAQRNDFKKGPWGCGKDVQGPDEKRKNTQLLTRVDSKGSKRRPANLHLKAWVRLKTKHEESEKDKQGPPLGGDLESNTHVMKNHRQGKNTREKGRHDPKNG